MRRKRRNKSDIENKSNLSFGWKCKSQLNYFVNCWFKFVVFLLVYDCLVNHLFQILLKSLNFCLIFYVFLLYIFVIFFFISFFLLLFPQIASPVKRLPIHRLQYFSDHFFQLRIKTWTKLVHSLFVLLDKGVRFELFLLMSRGNNFTFIDFFFVFKKIFDEHSFEGIEWSFETYLFGLYVVYNLVCKDIVIFPQKFHSWNQLTIF